MHPPSSKRKQSQQKQEHTTFTVGGLFWKKAKIRVVEKKQKAKHISHGDFRLKIQTRFQSRHSVNIYSPTAYIHTHTHKMSSTDALTTAGRHLLSFDFTSNNDHLHDFEWSASSSSFVLYSPLSCFILENFSNASRDSLVIDDAFAPRAPHATASIKQRLSEEQRRCAATVSLSFDML